MGDGRAEAVLVEALVLWSVDRAASREVVELAAEAVAEGCDLSWVLALACLPLDASANDLEDVLEASSGGLSVPLLPRGNPEIVVAGAMAMVRCCAAGDVAPRELARWAHEVIGHSLSGELEPLVSLDDSYDTAGYFGDSTEDVDELVRAEVRRLVGRYPDPVRLRRW